MRSTWMARLARNGEAASPSRPCSRTVKPGFVSANAQGLGVALGTELVQEPGRALDVSEEEGDRA
jgi:hypothetical protein